MNDLIKRHIHSEIVQMLDHFPGVIIEGARQVGKSTLTRQIAGEDAVFRNLDHEHVRAAAEADPAGFIAEGQGKLLVVDEIQRLPELTLSVKAAIDEDRRPGRFLLTGSSSLLRVRGLADSLAGRVARVPLYGLSQGEVRGNLDDFIAFIAEHHAEVSRVDSPLAKHDYARMLATGAYPELQNVSLKIRSVWIDGYLQGVIGRDLRELRREVQPTRSMSILRTLAGRQSAELVKSKLAEETSVPARTVTGYLDLLHDVWLVASIPSWTPNLAKREIGRPKSFVVDSAVAMWLTKLTQEQLTRLEYGEAFGSLLEAFVGAELLRQRTWTDRPFDLFHYRAHNGEEVDYVLELHDGSVIAIEVKAASGFTAKQFRGLAALRDRLGSRFIAGIVLNTGSTGYRYADRLYGAPIASLWSHAEVANSRR